MKLFGVFCMVGLLSLASFAAPTQVIYGNNATGGTPYIFQIDPVSGAVLNTYTNLSGNNGRGVVNVGNILYYTTAGDNNVYKYDVSTQTNLGIAFSVAGSSALSTIAYDGTNFWIGDYSGTNNAYLYSPTGTLLNTVSLSLCGGFCDGLEFFKQGSQGFLISNRFDGGFGGANTYDVYDLNGNLVHANLFTTTSSASTGIAYNGVDFYVSDIFAGSLSVYDINGNFVQTIPLTGASLTPVIEDLSFNYQQVLGTPEPGTLVMFGSGIVGLAGLLRRKFLA